MSGMPAKRKRDASHSAQISAVAARKAAQMLQQANTEKDEEETDQKVTISNSDDNDAAQVSSHSDNDSDIASQKEEKQAATKTNRNKNSQNYTKTASKKSRYFVDNKDTSNNNNKTDLDSLPKAKIFTPGRRSPPQRKTLKSSSYIDPGCESFIPSLDERQKVKLLQQELNLANIQLHPSEYIVMYGLFELTVELGLVEVMGSQLSADKNKKYQFYCPSTHPLPKIYNPSTSDICKIQLSNLPEVGVSDFESIAKRGMIISNKSTMFLPKSNTSPTLSTFTILFEPLPNTTVIAFPLDWTEFLQALSNSTNADINLDGRTVVMIEGTKGTGKSTLGRASLNRLLNFHPAVAWLEADIGQPEFGPVGLVTLHTFDKPRFGASFASQSLPYHAFFVGSISPRNDPSKYLQCITNLMELYEAECEILGIPLIVNVPGWTKGLGENTITSIKNIVRPTYQIDLPPSVTQSLIHPSSSIPQLESSPSIPTNSTTLSVAPAPSAPPSTWTSKLTPTESRILNILAYLHRREDRQGYPIWDFDTPLTHAIPLVVDWSHFNVKNNHDAGIWWGELHSLTHGYTMEEKIVETLAALNGSIVGLLGRSLNPEDDEDEDDQNLEEKDSRRREENEKEEDRSLFTPRACTSSVISNRPCLGIALVRSIDVLKRQFHLLVPPSSMMPISNTKSHEDNGTCVTSSFLQQECVGLVLGDELDLPVLGMLGREDEDYIQNGLAGNPWNEVPYLTKQRLQGQGGAKRRFRKNIMRRSQRT